MLSPDELSHRLTLVRQRIQRACERSHRDPSSVTLVCVTKTIPADVIAQIVAFGVTDVGENRVQEARAKRLALGSRLHAQTSNLEPRTSNLEPIRWHLIGHLQRNKAKAAVELFEVIHSVDSIELVEELERHAAKRVQGSRLKAQGANFRLPASSFQPLEVFVQVNISGEATKFGCRPQAVNSLAQQVQRSPQLHLAGLMTIAPFSDDPEHARPHFRKLRELRDALAAAYRLLPTAFRLSMGMSQDFEVAIEEGADLIRVGTAIFGERTT